MRWLIAILLALLVMLQFRLWFGDGGYREVRALQGRVDEQIERNEALSRRNAELRAEVEDLRDRLEAVEERARSELGLIKEGEEFYQVIPPPVDRGKGDG